MFGNTKTQNNTGNSFQNTQTVACIEFQDISDGLCLIKKAYDTSGRFFHQMYEEKSASPYGV